MSPVLSDRELREAHRQNIEKRSLLARQIRELRREERLILAELRERRKERNTENENQGRE